MSVVVESPPDRTFAAPVCIDQKAKWREEIHKEHQLARESAVDAIKHAVACGELLLQVKAKTLHGKFCGWIAANCEFSQATANNYMRAARNPNAVSNSIRHLFPSGRISRQKEDKRSPRNSTRIEQEHSEKIGGESITVFLRGLRQEITRRRKANHDARMKRNWDVDAVSKLEMHRLIDWIEDELDKVMPS